MATVCVRDGLCWSLDLDEGIDFKIWLFGQFEPEISQFYNNYLKPGMLVLDLGANIGAHTLPLARAVGPTGHVVAIEATDYACAKLGKNLELNPGLLNVNLVQAFLVDMLKKPKSSLPKGVESSWPLTTCNSIHPTLRAASKAITRASALTLDEVIKQERLNKIDLVKMDVDGHELEVVKGAQNLLQQEKPPIIMELAPYCYNPREKFDELIALLSNIGYKFYTLPKMRNLPSTLSKLKTNIPENGSINVVALAKALQSRAMSSQCA